MANHRLLRSGLFINPGVSTLKIKDLPALKKWGIAKAANGVQLIPGKGLNDGFFYTLLLKTQKS